MEASHADRLPPRRPSDEAMAEQLRLGKAQGDAFG